ncbi:MAG: nucleotidyltransferase family protein [Gemmatimonadaceae bacterium]
MGSTIVYELVARVVRGTACDARLRKRAFAAPLDCWRRVLGFDGCAVQFDRALQRSGLASETPLALRRFLREETGVALQRALLVHTQLAEVAALCAANGIGVMALKGAARLLTGELPGMRSIADIDLLADPRDAERLHALLQRELRYTLGGNAYPHHLAGLTRPGSLGIELHHRLTPTPLPLDALVWQDARAVVAGTDRIAAPSPTMLLLHTLEHAARVNWTARYRLRDVLDVAVLSAAEIDREFVEKYVAASDCRAPMQALLAAGGAVAGSGTANDGARGWRLVRRVGRARIALAGWPRAPRVAERFFRYAGVAAEGSPRTICRAGLDLARRALVGGRAAALAVTAILTACEQPVAPAQFTVSPFVFASETGGVWSLYRYREGAVTQLSTPGFDDRDPKVVGNHIVFTSLRDGDPEIYGATLAPDLTMSAQTRLTNEYGNDGEPALSSSGSTIAFVSGRDGTPRIWLMDANGANPRALATGSASYIPEQAPAWSPSGDRIVFTSTRTGSSQVFVIAAAGGVATQLSHETRGAFTPSWMPDGNAVLFTATPGDARVMRVPAGGGDATVFATDSSGIGEASCTSQLCLAVTGTLGSAGRVVALKRDGRPSGITLPSVADDHAPALLTPLAP